MKELNLKIASNFSVENSNFSKMPTAKLVREDIFLKEENLFDAQQNPNYIKCMKILKILNLQKPSVAPKENVHTNNPTYPNNPNVKEFLYDPKVPNIHGNPFDLKDNQFSTFSHPPQVTKECNHEEQNYNNSKMKNKNKNFEDLLNIKDHIIRSSQMVQKQEIPPVSKGIKNLNDNYNLEEEINDSFTRNSSPKSNNINSILNQIKIQANLKRYECKFCISTNKDSLIKLSYSIIYKKYEERAINILNSNIISDILFNSKSRIRSIYKDFLLYDCNSEFLERLFIKAQSSKIIQLYGQLTISTFHLGPNYFCLDKERSFLFKNIEKKLKNNLEYEIHNKKNDNRFSENEINNNKIFNSAFLKYLESSRNSKNEDVKQNEFKNLIENFMNEDSIEHSNLNLKALTYTNQEILEEIKDSNPLSILQDKFKCKPLDIQNNKNNNFHDSSNLHSIFSFVNSPNQRASNLQKPLPNPIVSQIQFGTSINHIPQAEPVPLIHPEQKKGKGLIEGVKYIIDSNIVNKKTLKLKLKSDLEDVHKFIKISKPKALETKQFNLASTQRITKKNSLSPNVVRNSSINHLKDKNNGKDIISSNIRINPQKKINPIHQNKKRILNFPRSLSNLSPFFSTTKISNKLNSNYKTQAQHIRNNMNQGNPRQKKIERSISTNLKGNCLPAQISNSLYNNITFEQNLIKPSINTKSRLVISGEKKTVFKSSNKLSLVNSN